MQAPSGEAFHVAARLDHLPGKPLAWVDRAASLPGKEDAASEGVTFLPGKEARAFEDALCFPGRHPERRTVAIASREGSEALRRVRGLPGKANPSYHLDVLVDLVVVIGADIDGDGNVNLVSTR
jgi:hypothetical protein